REENNAVKNAHKLLGMFGITQAKQAEIQQSPANNFFDILTDNTTIPETTKKEMLRSAARDPETIDFLTRHGIIKKPARHPRSVRELELTDSNKDLQHVIDERAREIESYVATLTPDERDDFYKNTERKARALDKARKKGRSHTVPQDYDDYVKGS
ncbi:hypothetical protein, partial [Oenococcus oeni]|uniref:hypothetical protein n=1 Tax=Oenococcus oeni TaxID=1247 RepID=UPI0015D66BA9